MRVASSTPQLIGIAFLVSAMAGATAGPVRAQPSGPEASDATEGSGAADAAGGGRDSAAGDRREVTAGDESPAGERVDPVFRRPPSKVRRAPIAFSSQLEPIGPKRTKRFLKALCDEPPVRVSLKNREQKVWACRRCPGFTSLAESEGPLVLEEILRGSFVEAGEREAFVTYRGCEPQNAAYGGAVVFRRRSGSWEPVYRHPGLHPQACLKFPSKRHADGLLCRLRYESDGRVIEKIVDAATPHGAVKIARSVDNSAQCPSDRLLSSYLIGWKREDVDGDGRPDVLVEKLQRQEPIAGRKGRNEKNEREERGEKSESAESSERGESAETSEESEGDERRVCSLEQTDGSWDRARVMTILIRFTGGRFRLKGRRFDPLPASARRPENYATIEKPPSDSKGVRSRERVPKRSSRARSATRPEGTPAEGSSSD